MKKVISWTYRNVADFLAENDFSFSEELDDSVQSWVKLAKSGEPVRFVDIPFTNTFYTQRILKRIIRESGIPEEKWIAWAENPRNGKGGAS